MKAKIILAIVTFLSLISNSYTQNLNLNRAKSEYNQLYYVKTTDILLKVAEKGFESQELFEKLGNSLYFNNRMEEANKWYKKLFDVYEKNLDPEYYYRFAMTYKALKNYEQADKLLSKFEEIRKEELRIKSFENYKAGNFDLNKLDEDIKLINLPINTLNSDFAAFVQNDKLYFSSPKTDVNSQKYSWNEQSYLDIFSVPILKLEVENIKLGSPQAFYDGINSKYHDTNISFLNDSIVFFTRNNYYKNRKFKDGKGTNQLTILMANIKDTANIKPKPISINNKKFTIAHSVFNKTKTRMYFSSNRSGFGQSDLFYVAIDSLGNINGEPINLGESINTEGKESFPFISDEGDLYFASDGHYGFGGMDIYKVPFFDEKLKDSLNNKILVDNLGKPFNSEFDDFAFINLNNGKFGFLSSNRKGGIGDDDIYYYSRKCTATFEGLVVDKKTQEVIANANVSYFENGVLKNTIESDDEGKFTFDIDCNSSYQFKAEKESYIPDQKNLTTNNETDHYKLKLELEQNVKPFSKGDDVAKLFDIKSIYFDFDKDEIKPVAAVELQKVIEFLNEYPKLSITINSHTDSRGSAKYNLSLSKRRNNSTIKYIIEVGGIDKSRVTGNGYGEERLLNNCSDGVKCTEEEHQLNRRSEFLIN